MVVRDFFPIGIKFVSLSSPPTMMRFLVLLPLLSPVLLATATPPLLLGGNSTATTPTGGLVGVDCEVEYPGSTRLANGKCYFLSKTKLSRTDCIGLAGQTRVTAFPVPMDLSVTEDDPTLGNEQYFACTCGSIGGRRQPESFAPGDPLCMEAWCLADEKSSCSVTDPYYTAIKRISTTLPLGQFVYSARELVRMVRKLKKKKQDLVFATAIGTTLMWATATTILGAFATAVIPLLQLVIAALGLEPKEPGPLLMKYLGGFGLLLFYGLGRWGDDDTLYRRHTQTNLSLSPD